MVCMKTLRISNSAHRQLTRWFGHMTAQTSKNKTYCDVVETLVSQAILLPPEHVKHIDEFIEASEQSGYMTREEFIREAVTEAFRRRAVKHEQTLYSDKTG